MQIATFEKVSFEQFLKSYSDCGYISQTPTEHDIKSTRQIWQNIKLPTRKTTGSAGYDFYLPEDYLMCSTPQIIPTGIRAKMNEDYVLLIMPRSSLGFKNHLQLSNTIGIIDADYYNADNEGHIMIKCFTDDTYSFEKDIRFVQGIFVPYGIATNGNLYEKRTGGIGSTGV